MKKIQFNGRYENQNGASLVEFIIVAPVIFILGLGTLQAGLLYHNKSVLNYATFEAARVGSTRHAQHKPMRRELGIRLAPIIGGDGSLKRAAIAMARTSTDVESVIGLTGDIGPPTMLTILSPDEAAFSNWGKPSLEYVNRHVIPNSHLKHQGSEIRGGLSLQDANLLKIEVVHGVELKVPIVGPMLAGMLLKVLPDDDPHRLYYLSGKFPLKSTATIRMQSEAWKGAIDEAREKPYGEMVAALEDIADDLESKAIDAIKDWGKDCGEDGIGNLSLSDSDSELAIVTGSQSFDISTIPENSSPVTSTDYSASDALDDLLNPDDGFGDLQITNCLWAPPKGRWGEC